RGGRKGQGRRPVGARRPSKGPPWTFGAPAAVDAERERMRRELARRRERMIAWVDELFKIPYITPLGGFYLFADFSRWGSSLDLARRILNEAKVVTIPGIAFGSQGEGFLRLSFAASEEDIETGLRRMADLLRRDGQG